jgi:putative addiction module component (TIGR02574 family)
MADVSIDQLRGLPLERRLEIIEALWDSVEAEVRPFPISDELAGELDRRFPEHVDDPESSIPWEQVRAAMRRRLADLGAPAELRLSHAEQAEIDRRLAEHKRNPGAARPVDTFLNELDGRYV